VTSRKVSALTIGLLCLSRVVLAPGCGDDDDSGPDVDADTEAWEQAQE
jgi:hypothetical protein